MRTDPHLLALRDTGYTQWGCGTDVSVDDLIQSAECRCNVLLKENAALTLRCEELRKDAESKKDDVIEVLAEMVRDTPCKGRPGEAERHERLAHFAQKLKKIIDRKPAALSREQNQDASPPA